MMDLVIERSERKQELLSVATSLFEDVAQFLQLRFCVHIRFAFWFVIF